MATSMRDPDPPHTADASLLAAVDVCWRDVNVINGRLLVGVSGGCDSVALLRTILALSQRSELEILAAHFDHGWRTTSDNDAKWVGDLCSSWGVTLMTERAPYGSPINEETARRLRYDFLKRVALEHGCRWIAVGHTCDDQVETVLHQLLRGSGLAGAAGMSPQRELAPGLVLLRPFLSVARTEVAASLAAAGQTFLSDATNADPAWTRNRIRLNVLPLLREQVNQRVDSALLRFAQQAAEAQAALEVWADQLEAFADWDRSAEHVDVDVTSFQSAPLAVLRTLWARVWAAQQWPRQALTFEHLDLLARMTADGQPRRASLASGVDAVRRRRRLRLTRSAPP